MKRMLSYPAYYAWGCFIALFFVLTMMGGCGPKLGKSFVKLDNIPPGKAVVYLYRPFGNLGYLIPIDIYSNEMPIVTMPHESYYPYLVEPGEVEFNARHGISRQIHESVTIQVKAGQTYFVKTTFRPLGITFQARAQVSLEAMLQEEGAEGIRECKLILDEGRDGVKSP